MAAIIKAHKDAVLAMVVVPVTRNGMEIAFILMCAQEKAVSSSQMAFYRGVWNNIYHPHASHSSLCW